ncbi:hypothetical protein BVI1335_2340021 [Burkholderia vietnamiensis]|nr:hypothetical protein BVI1335_2340021 [Burkholderia vietnamiensis]
MMHLTNRFRRSIAKREMYKKDVSNGGRFSYPSNGSLAKRVVWICIIGKIMQIT